MRKYGVVSPLFWTGDTGRLLRKYPDAQRMAAYLITCPNANMIGLYYLPLPVLCHELSLTTKGALKGLERVKEVGFADYEGASEIVFVYEMVRFQVGESLKANDKRVKGIDRELQQYRKSPFYNDFLLRYKELFHLKSEIYEAPCKGHLTRTRAGIDQETGTGIEERQQITPVLMDLRNLPQFSKFMISEDKWRESLIVWIEAYPDVNIEEEIRKSIAWIQSNPVKAPKKDIYRFINGWLGRSRTPPAYKSQQSLHPLANMKGLLTTEQQAAAESDD